MANDLDNLGKPKNVFNILEKSENFNTKQKEYKNNYGIF